jgi:exodeoxyribonuclease-3
MRLASWNVNGWRALARKGLFDGFMEAARPDVICLQETKVDETTARVTDLGLETPLEALFPHQIWHSGARPGYSGTAVLSRKAPVEVVTDLPRPRAREHVRDESHPPEGRLIGARFGDFFLVNVYVPNSRRGLERLSYRETEWDPALAAVLKRFGRSAPVIACGDFNVAHKPIDLANPKQNVRNAGFTEEERAGFTRLLGRAGLVDAYRHLYPEREGAYTWWTYRGDARARNIGWRIDYWLVSKKLLHLVRDVEILPGVHGSDHCPVVLDLEL